MKARDLKTNRSGFSLAEMLVAVGVFSIAMAVSSSIFINVNNMQQQTANMSKLQNEGRYVLEKIGKEIRGRELDYDLTVLDSAGLTDALVFKEDEFGDAYKIYFDAASQAIRVETTNIDAGTKDAALSADEVMVEKMQFLVSPLTDPYAVLSADPPLEQSRVTLMMVIKNREAPEKYRKTLQLQTTISSKTYH